MTLFKVEREQARLAELQTEKSEVRAEIGQLRTEKAEAEKAAKEAQTELRLLAPKLKHVEKLAAEYSSDPEDLLPLPARDYHRLCRAYGPESVAETVAAVKRQEQAEKEQKRSQKRRYDREAR